MKKMIRIDKYDVLATVAIGAIMLICLYTLAQVI